MALLISAVSAGDQGGFGTPGVSKSLDALDVTLGVQFSSGRPTIYSGSINGAGLSVDLTGVRPTPASAYSIGFYFGGTILATTVGKIDSLKFGTASVVNAAQGISATGIPPGITSRSLVYTSTASIPLDLDFTAAREAATGLNVGIYFGGTILVPAVTLGDQLVINHPISAITRAFGARPAGIPPLGVGDPRAILASVNGANADFNFVADRQEATALSVRFDFGDAVRPLPKVGGFTDEIFGNLGIVNTAQGISAQSIESTTTFGGEIVYQRITARDGVIDFNFVNANTVWNALNVPMQFYVAAGFGPEGFDSLVFGNLAIAKYFQDVFPEGINESAIGDLSAVYTQIVQPTGTDYSQYGAVDIVGPRTLAPATAGSGEAIGTLTIERNEQVIFVGGIPSKATYGAPWISYRNRIISNVGNIASGFSLTNTHHISHWVQYVSLQDSGIAPKGIGVPTATFAIRQVYPASFVGPYWGTAAVKRKYFVDPVGWDSAFISENAELLVNTKKVYVLTGEADPAQYGVASVINHRQDVNLHNNGWYDTQISFPVIYNLKREIVVGPFAENVDPTSWTNYYPYVENVDRVLGTFGHSSSRIGISTQIYNNAVPVFPEGTETTQWGAETFISHRNRAVLAQGWDSFYTTQFSVIWNLADVIAPVSLGDTSAYGRPDPVANLNREVKQHSGWVGPEFGTAFIAYAVRYVYPSLFYDVPAAFPEVRHNPYPIAPVGIPWQGQVGGHEARISRREVFPYSLNVHDPWFGEPIVRNRNIESTTFGYDHSEFGLADIQNYIRYLTPEWTTPEYFGTGYIGYRTRIVYPGPASVPVFPVWHHIFNNEPDPPSVQRILLNRTDSEGDEVDGYGIVPPNFVAPVIRLATIYPAGLDESARFGTLTAYANNIMPRFIFEDGLFGAHKIYLNRSFIAPEGIPKDANGDSRVSEGARFSPWNIYAPSGDARPNNYSPVNINAHPIGITTNTSFDNSAYPWFGRTTVTNKNRTIGPVPMRNGFGEDNFDYYPKFGVPTASLRRRYIHGQGIRSLRFGQIIFLNVPQYVNLDDEVNRQGINNHQQWGNNQVGYPPIPPDPNKYVYPAGQIFTGMPNTHRVELFNRTIYPTAIPHAGGSSGTNPWGVPLVGYPRSYVIGMGIQALWGTAVIEYKNREVHPEGWNSCSLEDDNFDDYWYPMEITRTNPEVVPEAIQSQTSFGNSAITLGTRTIYSRLIDGYNSGVHSVNARNSIIVSGWDGSAFGDIPLWEEGKIKLQGDDMSIMGTPRMLYPLRPSGASDNEFGEARVAANIRVYSIPEIGFDGPSITNPSGCGTRVVTPLPVLSTLVVAVPSIN